MQTGSTCGYIDTSLGRPLMAMLAALWLTGMAASQDEPTGPSFDCAKAATASEQAVCDSMLLTWFDRQMGKAYGLVRQILGPDRAASLKTGQTAFLKTRDACMTTADGEACMARAYGQRFAELATLIGSNTLEAGLFEAENGSLWTARFPDGRAAINLSTVGANTHTCTFETDSAEARDDGSLAYARKPDPSYEEACKLTVTASGDSRTVTAEGDGCTYFCGMRATMDGTYRRVRP